MPWAMLSRFQKIEMFFDSDSHFLQYFACLKLPVPETDFHKQA